MRDVLRVGPVEPFGAWGAALQALSKGRRRLHAPLCGELPGWVEGKGKVLEPLKDHLAAMQVCPEWEWAGGIAVPYCSSSCPSRLHAKYSYHESCAKQPESEEPLGEYCDIAVAELSRALLGLAENS